MLKFASPQARQQAELLMQPALIRVIDNIRKQLERSDWKASYQQTQIWPTGVSEAQMRRFKDLQTQLETADADTANNIQAQLQELPQPAPGYELHLEQGDRTCIIDIWDLCYRICFQQFPVTEGTVTVDDQLWDTEIGDVDWIALDEKTKALIERVFEQVNQPSEQAHSHRLG